MSLSSADSLPLTTTTRIAAASFDSSCFCTCSATMQPDASCDQMTMPCLFSHSGSANDGRSRADCSDVDAG